MLKTLFLAVLLPIAALAKTHDVQVGEIGIRYFPHELQAAPGDKVNFHYYPGSHGVAEGDYDAPCSPKKDGFWSGFINSPNKLGHQAPTMFTLTINDTEPIVIYCPNSDQHCRFGMSMFINPGPGMSLVDYRLRSKTTKPVVPKNIQGGKIGPSSPTTGIFGGESH